MVAGLVFGHMKNMFSVNFTIVASSGVYTGTGMARRVSVARAQAVGQAWDAMLAGDSAKGVCSGIAMEWMTVQRGGKTVFNGEAYS